MYLTHFNSPAILQVGMIERPLHRVIVTVGRDQVIATEDFFGLAIGTVGDFRPSNHLAGIFRQPVGATKEASAGGLLSPGDVFLQSRLHLFGAELGPASWIVIQKQEVVWHSSLLFISRACTARSR